MADNTARAWSCMGPGFVRLIAGTCETGKGDHQQVAASCHWERRTAGRSSEMGGERRGNRPSAAFPSLPSIASSCGSFRTVTLGARFQLGAPTTGRTELGCRHSTVGDGKRRFVSFHAVAIGIIQKLPFTRVGTEIDGLIISRNPCGRLVRFDHHAAHWILDSSHVPSLMDS